MHYITKFVLTFFVFMGIDLIWLGIIAKPLYRYYMGDLLRPVFYWPAAVLFYSLFIIGLIIFAIEPAIIAKDTKKAVVMGGLFGFFTYMTYELTNWAVLKNWPAGIVPIDILWGVILSASVCGVSTYLYLRFLS